MLTTLYTVPSLSAVVSSLTVCNQNSNTTANIRISIAVGGAADTQAQYLYYNLPIDSNNTFIATVGLTLASTDVIRVYSDQPNVSFQAFGDQIS